MSEEESEYTKPWIRHAVLWAGFAALVVIGIWTVVLPGVEDSPVDPEASEPGESDESGVNENDENINDSNN